MSQLDFPVLLSLAGAAVDDEVLRALERHGFGGLRPRHGYVVQRLLVAPATASEMAAALGVTQQAVAKTVGELVRLGYAETTVDPDDRRRRPVALSERGREVVARTRRTRSALERRVRRRVSAEDLATAVHVVEEVLDALGVREHLADRTAPPPGGVDD